MSVKKVLNIRPEPPPEGNKEVRVMIGGKPYLVGISDLRGGLKPLKNPNELQRSFQALVSKTNDAFQRKVVDEVKIGGKYSKLEMEFSETHDFQEARFFKSSAPSTAVETMDKVEEVFNEEIQEAVEEGGVPEPFQQLGESIARALAPRTDEHEELDLEEEAVHGPTPRIIRGNSTAYLDFHQEVTDGDGWTSITRGRDAQQNIFGAIAHEINRTQNPEPHADDKSVRRDISKALKDLASEANSMIESDEDADLSEIENFVDTLKHIFTGFKAIDLESSNTIKGLLKDHPRKEALNAALEGENLDEVDSQTKIDLLNLYAGYLEKGGNQLHLNTVTHLVQTFISDGKETIFFYAQDEEDAHVNCSGEKGQSDLTKTIILNITTDEDGLVTAVSVPKPEFLVTTGTERRRTEAATVDMTPYIKDCGGDGDCGPKSIIDQMIRLGLSWNEEEVTNESDLEAISLSMRANYADKLDEIAQAIEAEEDLDEAQEALKGFAIKDIDDAAGRKVVTALNETAKLRELAVKIRSADEWESINTSFLHHMSVVLAEQNEDLQIAIVRPNSEGTGHYIAEVFAIKHGELGKDNTLFLHYNAPEEDSLNGNHFQSIGNIDEEGFDVAISELLKQREISQMQRLLEEASDGRVREEDLANRFLNLGDTSPAAYKAMCLVAYEESCRVKGIPIPEEQEDSEKIDQGLAIINSLAFLRNPTIDEAEIDFENLVLAKIEQIYTGEE